MSKTPTRIYCVSDGENDFLVRAVSQAQAIGHVTRGFYKARVATQDDLATLCGNGVRVETAGAHEGPQS